MSIKDLIAILFVLFFSMLLAHYLYVSAPKTPKKVYNVTPPLNRTTTTLIRTTTTVDYSSLLEKFRRKRWAENTRIMTRILCNRLFLYNLTKVKQGDFTCTIWDRTCICVSPPR